MIDMFLCGSTDDANVVVSMDVGKFDFHLKRNASFNESVFQLSSTLFSLLWLIYN